MIDNSVIGLRCLIGRNCVIRNAIIMGNDYFDEPNDAQPVRRRATAPGHRVRLPYRRAIIDKNCHIGNGVRIINERAVRTPTRIDFGLIRDGIVCMPKG